MQLRPSHPQPGGLSRVRRAVPTLVMLLVLALMGLDMLAPATKVWASLPRKTQEMWALSEVRIDQPGSDLDEYFELVGSPDQPLAGMAYLVLGDDGTSGGVIEAVIPLDYAVAPAGGYLVAAEGTFTLGIADLTTTLNFENADNVTHLLVTAFSGANGDDLDVDDDGVLDVMPWSETIDCLALLASLSGGDPVYCQSTVGPDQGSSPGHAYRCPDGWRVGPLDVHAGHDTPGAANTCGEPSPTPTPTPGPSPTATATGEPSSITLAGTGFSQRRQGNSVWVALCLALAALVRAAARRPSP